MDDSSDQLNILVIEDDAALRDMLAQVLSREGHQAILADSAEEGLQLLPQWTFQVALVDHNLPGMEGLVLGEYLRRNNPDMSIVMMTGSEDPRVERKSRDLALTFLPKPFQVPQLLSILDEFVDAARQRDSARQEREDAQYDPPIESFANELTECFAVPSVPGRIEGRLVETVKRCLQNLGSVARYTERERVMALSGLLTARVLGVELPRTKSGKTLFEEYDRLMLARGRRTAFGPAGASDR